MTGWKFLGYTIHRGKSGIIKSRKGHAFLHLKKRRKSKTKGIIAHTHVYKNPITGRIRKVRCTKKNCPGVSR